MFRSIVNACSVTDLALKAKTIIGMISRPMPRLTAQFTTTQSGNCSALVPGTEYGTVTANSTYRCISAIARYAGIVSQKCN